MCMALFPPFSIMSCLSLFSLSLIRSVCLYVPVSCPFPHYVSLNLFSCFVNLSFPSFLSWFVEWFTLASFNQPQLETPEKKSIFGITMKSTPLFYDQLLNGQVVRMMGGRGSNVYEFNDNDKATVWGVKVMNMILRNLFMSLDTIEAGADVSTIVPWSISRGRDQLYPHHHNLTISPVSSCSFKTELLVAEKTTGKILSASYFHFSSHLMSDSWSVIWWVGMLHIFLYALTVSLQAVSPSVIMIMSLLGLPQCMRVSRYYSSKTEWPLLQILINRQPMRCTWQTML